MKPDAVVMRPLAPSVSKPEIRALTSLRGVAALAVVMQHFSVTAQSHCDQWLPSLVPHGYLAVDLFFVLSGFIMAYTYRDNFLSHPLLAFADFLQKRVARIVPLNLTVLAAILLAGQASLWLLGRNIIYETRDLWRDIVLNVFMLQGLIPGTNLNGPSWSISVEFAAYLAFPLFLFLIFHRSRWVSAAALAGCAAALCAMALNAPGFRFDAENGLPAVTRCFTEFAIGLAVYRAYCSQLRGGWLSNDGVCFAVMAMCLLMMGLRLDLLFVLGTPVLILVLALNRGRAARLMAHPILHFLGVVSFSLYLIHQMFRPIDLEILRALHPAPVSVTVGMGFALLGSLLVIPFAWLTFTAIERPGRRIVRHMVRRS